MSTATGDSSIATTPLELLGSHPGLNVVDPGTILTRLWYFDGKFLRAAGFRLDQEYVRSLVALSNQATGSGVVHGFNVAHAGGDRLRIEGGLGLAPSGRVVYLPQRVELSIAELIARSAGTFDPSAVLDPGVADFHPCPPGEPAGPEVSVPARPLYVLTVAGIEALCGEEERFGQLCEDACATETDRSKVVEGVCFRVRELILALPSSTAVPFGNEHLRSRVASAFFEKERRAVPSMISGAGLRNPVWCAAAPGIGGEEIALAVFDRSGAVTSFVDDWTARRELMEPTPRRYWEWRMAMRPWDVFLAQVLQFQCQLLDLGAAAGDPCADERDTLVAAGALLTDLTADPSQAARAHPADATGVLPPDAFSRVEALRAKITAVLGAGPLHASGSLLIDGGIVELPAAGYLPTSLQSEVAVQVRALLGPGVDLRFCAVRPDYVPEAVLQAQHMERISLTRGIDNPEDLEEVDILVPGGEVVVAPGSTVAAFTGTGHVQGPDEGKSVSFSVVARDSTVAGWSWTLAAYGERTAPLSVSELVGAVLPAASEFLAEAMPGDGSDAGTVGAPRTEVGEDRPVAVWLDVETALGLDTLPVGGSTDARLRVCGYIWDADKPTLVDIRVSATLHVADVKVSGPQAVIRTVVLDGVADTFAGRTNLVLLKPIPLSWTITLTPATSTRTLTVSAGSGGGRSRLADNVSFIDIGDPRHIVGKGFISKTTPSLELDEQDGALAPGSVGRNVADAVISLLGTELAKSGRDPAFAAYAASRLLGAVGGEAPQQIRATTDWVLFHRRRTRVCTGEVVEPPVRTRTYRLLHCKSDGAVEVPGALSGVGVNDCDFEPVATLEFPQGQVELRTPASVLRASWQASHRGNRLRMAGVGDLGPGDGEPVALGRLAVVQSLLADLVDGSEAQVRYLHQIPPEFQEPGLDGVMITVGFDEVASDCMTVYRFSPSDLDKVTGSLKVVGDAKSLPDIMAEVEVVAEQFTVEFENDQVVESENRKSEWVGRAPRAVLLGLPSSSDDAAVTTWKLRAGRYATLIGLGGSFGHVAAQTGDCGAVFLVSAVSTAN
jgi:hypothetical protein